MKAFAAIFDFLPGWIWAALVAAAFAANCSTGNRLDAERLAHGQTKTDHANTTTEFAEYRAAAARSALILSEQYRTTEQELLNAQETINQQTQTLLEVVERARAADRVAGQRLRDAAQDLASAARARCALAPTPGYSTPGDDPIGVLADVLGRADARAGELAAVADESRIRGLTCERAYEQAREALAG